MKVNGVLVQRVWRAQPENGSSFSTVMMNSCRMLSRLSREQSQSMGIDGFASASVIDMMTARDHRTRFLMHRCFSISELIYAGKPVLYAQMRYGLPEQVPLSKCRFRRDAAFTPGITSPSTRPSAHCFCLNAWQ